MLQRVVISWTKIFRKGKDFFGQRELSAYGPYVEWVEERARTLQLPFAREDPLYLQFDKLQHDVPKERFYQVQGERINILALTWEPN